MNVFVWVFFQFHFRQTLIEGLHRTAQRPTRGREDEEVVYIAHIKQIGLSKLLIQFG